MANSNKDINRSRRRFLEAVIASAVAVGAGVIGYEIGKEIIKCPPNVRHAHNQQRVFNVNALPVLPNLFLKVMTT